MAYGDNRTEVASDDFSTDPFTSRWSNGEGQWFNMAWGGSDYVGPANTNQDAGMRRSNSETFANDQYCRGTWQAFTTQVNTWPGLRVRSASGNDESCYFFGPRGSGNTDYAIHEVSSSFNFTLLTNGGSHLNDGPGDTLTTEVEGTTIRGGSDESGTDTQALTTTDATIASGDPGINLYDQNSTTRTLFDAWSAGDIGVVGVTGSGTPQAQSATASGTGVKENIGSGTPQAQAATASGTGVKENIGSGTPQAQAATAAGTGKASIDGTGAPQAQAAAASGTGVKENIGSGAPQAQSATASGTGVKENVGSGTPQAQSATASGTGVKENIGSGTPQAQSATASGTGVASDSVLGSGTPQAQAATASGTGIKENVATGAPQAQAATASGTGVKENIGSGAPSAQAATAAGTGTAADGVVGSGTPQAQAATASGTGLKVVTGTGAVQAQNATITAVASHDGDTAVEQGGGSGGLEFVPNYQGRMRRPEVSDTVADVVSLEIAAEDDAEELALLAIAAIEALAA